MKLADPRTSKPVNTIDGPGRELKCGQRVTAQRLFTQNFAQRLLTKDRVYRTTQFPPGSVNVTMVDATGDAPAVEEATPASPTADDTIEGLQREMSTLV